MANISVGLPADGDTIDVADYNTPINTIVNEINGSLDNSNISATAAIAGSKLADGAITNAKLSTTAGDVGGVWVSYTPTFANLSGGTLNYAKWTQVGKTVQVRFKYTLAGAGMGTAPTMTLPTAPAADYTTADGTSLNSTVSYIDLGINYYAGIVLLNGSSIVAFRVQSGTTINAPTSTVPFTWGTGDFVQGHITYEAA